MIDPSAILSTVLGGVIALAISVGISRREFNRQQKQQDQNWYRSVHNIVIRVFGSRDIDMMTKDKESTREYARLYDSYAEQIETQLADAPEEVGFELFNSLQNIEVTCIRYSQEVHSPRTNGNRLRMQHETMLDFCLIALYAIEKDISPDVDFLQTLEDSGDLDEAKELYQKFASGNLYHKVEDGEAHSDLSFEDWIEFYEE